MAQLTLQCPCGRVQGTVTAPPMNYARCYCTDCRAFMHWLERDEFLDPQGGVDLLQVPRNALRIDRGLEEVRGLRLTDKGMYRWHTACCRAPIANMGKGLPFAGVSANLLGIPESQRAERLGPTLRSGAKTALGTPKPRNSSLGTVLRVVAQILAWKLTGRSHPTPFFSGEERPALPGEVLTPAQRQALREHPRA